MSSSSSKLPPTPDSHFVFADRLARASCDLFDSLKQHGKPTVRPNGIPEWTVLAVISLVLPAEEPEERYIVPISLGSGVKVLPAAKLPPLGDVVHDCHAEVIARRGFKRWLIDEAKRIMTGGNTIGVMEMRPNEQFGLKEGVQVWLYVSTLPVSSNSQLYPLPSSIS
jgi:tRNA-specific adenosine deaminase 1